MVFIQTNHSWATDAASKYLHFKKWKTPTHCSRLPVLPSNQIVHFVSRVLIPAVFQLMKPAWCPACSLSGGLSVQPGAASKGTLTALQSKHSQDDVVATGMQKPW